MTVGSVFSGIGGLDLGFEWAGCDVRWQVEQNPFCQAVLLEALGNAVVPQVAYIVACRARAILEGL